MQVLILLALLPACLGFLQCGDLSPGEMAHILFLDADKNNDTHLALGEMLYLFESYDTNDDARITRREFQQVIHQREPKLEPVYDSLFDVFDYDGDHNLDLHDFVNFYLIMDPDNDNTVTMYAFIGYWTNLYEGLLDLHSDTC